MNYEVIARVKMFSKPGISPTVKNGNDVGYSIIGDMFSSTRNVNGWLAVNDASNKWIQVSACDEATVTPPPPDYPEAKIFQWRKQVGKNDDGSPVMEPWHEGTYYE